jgi:hypothetical protein
MQQTEPVNVTVGMAILDTEEIDSHGQSVTLQLKLELAWTDGRLEWPKGTPPENQSYQFDPAVLK